MILFDEKQMKNKIKNIRDERTLKINIEEKPERRSYHISNDKELKKFIVKCERECRSSGEYKRYTAFLKKYMDYSRCAVLKGLKTGNGKKYSIEIHHSPFTLFDLCHIIIKKRLQLNEPISPHYVAEEVMINHYDGKVGLIPLSVTMHELVHDDQVFIPLQYVYQNYFDFWDEYEEFIPEITKEKVNLMCTLSEKCEGDILSNSISPEFTYLEVEGISLPKLTEEWANTIRAHDFERIEIVA